MTDREKAINSLASAYVQSGAVRDMTAAKQKAEADITALAQKNMDNTSLRLGKKDEDFFNEAASTLLSEHRTKVMPAANASRSKTGKPRLPSKKTKDGKYNAQHPGQEEQKAAELDDQAAAAVGGKPAQGAIGSGSIVPINQVDTTNTNNANNARNSQKTQQTNEVVETAKENLDGVRGALTGSKAEEVDENGEAEESLKITGSGNDNENNEIDWQKTPKRYYSVWDAYFKGAFGEPGSREAKSGAAYYTVDAIANYLKNVGKGIGNIGAQYTGGTVDNSESTSEWDKAMDVMNEEQREKWGEEYGGKRGRKAVQEDLANKITELNKAKLTNDVEIQAYCMRRAKAATNKYDRMLWMSLAQSGLSDPGSAIGSQILSDITNAIGNRTGWF